MYRNTYRFGVVDERVVKVIAVAEIDEVFEPLQLLPLPSGILRLITKHRS